MAPRHSYVPASVIFDPLLTPTAKAVAAVLGVYMNPERGAYPSTAKIGSHLSLSARTIQRSVDELVDRGHVDQTVRRGNSNLYYWTFREATSVSTLSIIPLTPMSGEMRHPCHPNVPSNGPIKTLERSQGFETHEPEPLYRSLMSMAHDFGLRREA